MKKIISMILLGFTLMATAQHGSEARQRKQQFTAEQQAILQTKQMVLDLDLNAAQQKQLLSLNNKQAQLREKLKKQHRAMKKSEEKPNQDEIFKMKAEMLDSRIAHQAEVKKILNEKQYEQWRVKSKKMKKMKMAKMHKKHKEHGEHGKMKRKS